MKNNKGAITLYVSVACLFIVLVGVGGYILSANRQVSQNEQLNQIQSQYTGKQTQDELYNQYSGGEIIPIYTAEQLMKIGSGEELYIDGKIYTMTVDKTYILKENLEENENYSSIVQSVEDGNGIIIKEYE